MTTSDFLERAAPSALAEAAAVAPAPAVRLEGVCKSFGRATAPVLDDINLDVAAGELLCVLGASGCGKSTLLNLIAGLDRQTGGRITVDGGHAALMFQESALFPWLTAAGNVELALRLRKVPKAERRTEAKRLLSLVRLDGAADKRVHELSGGMRQRVAMARALAQNSAVLLMDEPFAALDAITRDVLHEELVSLWDGNARAGRPLAIVFVTHNVREAVRLGQRVVLLSSRPGRVAREWTVDMPQPRRIEDTGVAGLAAEITAELRREISRHA
ncbi:ABC transporter ATP-binding protein [Actinospica sp.]|uniref:ABC transporter ATP-binding protein n=1 Tax=Actinospica sp. TaxID=1872142 RepID=UPI002CB7D177|nr:ABC transporter ATP-binding protein [Actinospica sp.]HWG24747.1 ABC transporter ATP-binding protein [Actinospica sp.]